MAIRDPLSGIPIQYKLALMFLSVCLLAFGVGGVIVTDTAKDALRGEILSRLDFEAKAYATALEGRLHTLARRTDDFASDGFIRDHTQALLSAPDDARRQQLENELRVHLLTNKLPLERAFLDLNLISSEGALVLAANVDPPESFLDDFMRDADPDSPWYSDLIEGGPGGDFPHLAVSTPLTSRTTGERLGHLVAWIHPGVWIVGALNSTDLDTGGEVERAKLRLIDSEGQSLLLDAALTEKEGRREDSDYVRAGSGIRRGSHQERVSPAERGIFTRENPISTNGWKVRVDLKQESFMAAVGGVQSRFIGVGLILSAIASLLLFFPMHYLAKPLVALSAAARRIKDGDFRTRVDVFSDDEIGELGRSFNLMAEAIEERNARLEHTADDLREGRDELRVERDRLEAVIHSIRGGLIVLDPDGRTIFSNRSARPILDQVGLNEPDFAPHHICGTNRTSSKDCVGCLFSPEAAPRSCVIETGGGVYEVHSTRLAPDRSGRSGRVLVSHDLSDRIAQDERQIHQERLAVLGEVAAVMAHELNNPLAAISMYNQMTAAEVADQPDLAENTDVIQRNVQTCKQTIRELLDYATDATPEIRAVSINGVLEDVSAFVRPLRERSGIGFELTLGDVDVEVTGDEVQIRQIFVNLIVNAIQAMKDAGGCVRVGARVEGEHVVCDITDDGPGIPREIADSVFRPFFTTKARGEGTGLGLPTSRRIAEMHGGGLELLESGPQGTTFRVRLRTLQDGST